MENAANWHSTTDDDDDDDNGDDDDDKSMQVARCHSTRLPVIKRTSSVMQRY